MKKHTPLFLHLVQDAKSSVDEISPVDLKKRLDNRDSFYLIDVREDAEWDTGHIPAAIHLSKGVIERDIEKTIPETEADIVVYCSGGFRSILVASNLQQMGYTKVSSLATGLQGWLDAGYGIEA